MTTLADIVSGPNLNRKNLQIEVLMSTNFIFKNSPKYNSNSLLRANEALELS